MTETNTATTENVDFPEYTTLLEIGYDPNDEQSIDGALKAIDKIEKQSNKDISNAESNLKRLQIKKDVRGATDEIQAEQEELENLLVDAKQRLAEVESDRNEVEGNRARIIQERERARLTEKAHGIEIDLGIDVSDDPILCCRLYSAMANTLMWSLESGRDFYHRQVAEMYQRRAGEDEGGVANDMNPIGTENQLEKRVEELEESRERMKVYLHALKMHYIDAREHIDPDATYIPQFLSKTRGEIRKQVQERQEQRIQERQKEREAVKSVVTSHMRMVDDAGTPG